jgi:hypothetical protein
MKKSELRQIIKEEIVKVLSENKNLITFKQLIDDGKGLIDAGLIHAGLNEIKKAARLYYGTGAITGKDAREALSHVKSKGLEKQFNDLDPDFDPAGGSGPDSNI